MEKKLVVLLLIISCAVILSTVNKYWAPFDEGIITVAGEVILRGQIPYRDFFLVNYPPGQAYILAFLYKIFGVSLEVGRFYTALIHVSIVMCMFFIAMSLTRKVSIALIVWFISLSSLGPRLSVLPFPIWPGIGFSIFSIFLFMRYVQSEKLSWLFYSGLAVGIASLFRHDIGVYLFLAIFISLFIYKRQIKEISVFTLSSVILPVLCLFYLLSKGAGKDLFESLVLFPFIHQKTAGLAFPKPCFNLNMIFHQSLYFIKVNQYYIPLLVYALSAIFLGDTLIKRRKFDKREIAVFLLFLFGLLSFNQVRVRTDPAHLLTSIQPAILLFGFILSESIFGKGMKTTPKYLFKLCAILLFFLFLLLVVKNADKSIKNIFRKPYKGSVVLTRFDRGSVYIPQEEKPDIVNVVSFIRANTTLDERIYIGNIIHWKDDFGGSLILYTLCERLPSTKYYEILPGLITQKRVQEEIAKSLSRKDVNFIVLQDIAYGDRYLRDTRPDEETRPHSDKNKMILDNYIKRHFYPVKKFGKYNVYKKKNPIL